MNLNEEKGKALQNKIYLQQSIQVKVTFTKPIWLFKNNATAADGYCNIVAKENIATLLQSFLTHCCCFFSIITFIYSDFLYIGPIVLKVVCSRFAAFSPFDTMLLY